MFISCSGFVMISQRWGLSVAIIKREFGDGRDRLLLGMIKGALWHVDGFLQFISQDKIQS